MDATTTWRGDLAEFQAHAAAREAADRCQAEACTRSRRFDRKGRRLSRYCAMHAARVTRHGEPGPAGPLHRFDDRALVAAYRKFRSASAVARELRVSRGRVAAAVKRLAPVEWNPSPPRVSRQPARKAIEAAAEVCRRRRDADYAALAPAIVRLRGEGRTMAEIAAEVGRCAQTVSRVLAAHAPELLGVRRRHGFKDGAAAAGPEGSARRWRRERRRYRERVLALHRTGLPINAIAKEIGRGWLFTKRVIEDAERLERQAEGPD